MEIHMPRSCIEQNTKLTFIYSEKKNIYHYVHVKFCSTQSHIL